MTEQRDLSELRAFAEKSIAAERYPKDYHFFTPYACDDCGVVPLELTIEYHTGSKEGNFRGVIHSLCLQCGRTKTAFSFTGAHRKREREEKPACKCGHKGFWVAKCERIEGDDGMMGFFDEGVIVGQCSACGTVRAFVTID
jgi:hypothetical protein